MGGIGIVGAGISGLQLALYLQGQGVGTTLYSSLSGEEIAAGPVQNFPTRWAPTLEREQRLGVHDKGHYPTTAVRVMLAGHQPLAIDGRLSGPADSTDFRMYLPRLLDIYEQRGGTVVVSPCGP